MSKKCWYVTYVNCANVFGTDHVCSELLEIIPNGNCGGPYLQDAEGRYNYNNASVKQLTIQVVSCSNCPGCCTDPLNPAQPYDCLNGGCIPKTIYSTPGVYANLADCQAGCAKNSNCTGECVSQEQMIQLQQAADLITSRLCG